MPLVASEIKDSTFSIFESSKALISLVEQFTRRIQITFGEYFIRRKVLFVPYLQHNSSKPEYLPFRGMGNHQEFLQNSYLKQDNLEHRQRLSACPLRRVYRFFSPVPKLFFHLISWHLILLRNYKKTRTNLIR